MTENRDIHIKYTISLFSEKVVSSNMEISQVRHVPIPLNTFLIKKSQVEPVVKISFVFLCLSSAADAVQILMKLMKILIKQFLGYLMTHE